MNSNFEPEAWDPSTVYITPPTYTRGRRHRSSWVSWLEVW